MAKLQTLPHPADKDRQVVTVGHQSDAVVFIQSGPVGKAVHSTCTHTMTQNRVSSLNIRS